MVTKLLSIQDIQRLENNYLNNTPKLLEELTPTQILFHLQQGILANERLYVVDMNLNHQPYNTMATRTKSELKQLKQEPNNSIIRFKRMCLHKRLEVINEFKYRQDIEKRDMKETRISCILLPVLIMLIIICHVFE